ncbi:hypothetical protein [Sphingomonas sp.]|uniref:hypothetical protein n=1 Tax=Sphingomonas sp. TaxID=28214 RepID=UPI003B00E2E9
MAFVRRSALTAAILALTAPALSQDASPTSSLRLRAAPARSGLVIDNPGGHAVMIDRIIRVDKWVGTRWTPLGTEMKAIGTCTANAATGPVRLEPHTSLSVVPWRGASCSGQCTRTCRANIDYPPGRFRFVVTTVQPAAQAVGPVFQLDRSIP